MYTIYKQLPLKMKYISENLTRLVQDMYAENYKTLMKGIKDLNKRRDILS